MRPTLPLALLLLACAKPVAAPEASTPAPATVVKTDLTPEGMAKAMDLPLYPGATTPDGMSSAPSVRDDGSTHYSMVLATNDPPAKVAAWYAKTLGLPTLGGSIFGKTKKGNDASIRVSAEAGRTLIRLKSIAYLR